MSLRLAAAIPRKAGGALTRRRPRLLSWRQSCLVANFWASVGEGAGGLLGVGEKTAAKLGDKPKAREGSYQALRLREASRMVPEELIICSSCWEA